MGHSSDSCIKAGPLASITIGSELGGLTGSSSTSGITVWRSKSEALVGCRETGSDWECGKIDNSSGKKYKAIISPFYLSNLLNVALLILYNGSAFSKYF